jgi:hypothetical protein
MRIGEFEADFSVHRLKVETHRKGLVVPKVCFLFLSINVHTDLCHI